MEIQIPVQQMAEYEVQILAICDDDSWGENSEGWDREDGKLELILQIPLQNGGSSALEIIDQTVAQASGIMEGAEWKFKSDPGVFREMMVPLMASRLEASMVALSSIGGSFRREFYIWAKITENLD